MSEDKIVSMVGVLIMGLTLEQIEYIRQFYERATGNRAEDCPGGDPKIDAVLKEPATTDQAAPKVISEDQRES